MSRYQVCQYDIDCNDEYNCCPEYAAKGDTYTYVCDTMKGCSDKGTIPDDRGYDKYGWLFISSCVILGITFIGFIMYFVWRCKKSKSELQSRISRTEILKKHNVDFNSLKPSPNTHKQDTIDTQNLFDEKLYEPLASTRGNNEEGVQAETPITNQSEITIDK